VFRVYEILQRLVVQGEIRDQAFQPGILMLQLSQSARLVDLEAAVLGLPAIERLFADAVPSAELRGFPARLGLFQDPDICSSVNCFRRIAGFLCLSAL
jgi:hypothetical protein